ncbi:MAG: hypothetical protein JRI25_26980 [Deltaproteobacteria bacterium]|nr:hypothetical protein [Deltaproteobacteria bacterium]
MADAGPDQTVFVTDTVTLDGSASSDDDGDTLSYFWSLLSTPAGSAATLSDSGAVGPTFDVDLPGSYVAQLIVNDGRTDSAPDTVTVSMRWIDDTPPAVTFQEPAATWLNTGEVDVRMAVSDPESGLDPEALFLFLDDVLTTSTSTQSDPFWHTANITAHLAGVLEGEHQLRVGVRDRAGNRGQAVKDIIVDLTPPTISATSDPPPNAAGWNRTTVTVRFDCADSLSGIASCPEPIIVDTEDANQVVSGTATDVAGNSAGIDVAVSIDKTPPGLTPVIDPPPNSNGWHNTEVTVSFVADDGLAGLAGVTAPVTLTTEGANQAVSGTAIDRADNSRALDVAVSLDKTPPNVAFTSPDDGTLRAVAAVTVKGTVSDGLSGLAGVICNDVAAEVSGTTFTCDLLLSEGDNEIVAQATDITGNVGVASLALRLDTTPPQLSITTPPANTVIFEPLVRVAGTVDDLNAQVRVNGLVAVVSGGPWEIDIPLAIGPNAITAVATDAAGNTSQLSRQVTRAVLTTLDLSPTTITLRGFGITQQLSLSGTFSDGSTRDLTAAASGTVYASSAPGVATVSTRPGAGGGHGYNHDHRHQ